MTSRCQGLFPPHPFFEGKALGTRLDIIKIENTRKKIKKNKPAKYKKQEKTFDEYFAECIKNKSIPKDAPPYLKKALKRALLEQGFKCPYITHIFYNPYNSIRK